MGWVLEHVIHIMTRASLIYCKSYYHQWTSSQDIIPGCFLFVTTVGVNVNLWWVILNLKLSIAIKIVVLFWQWNFCFQEVISILDSNKVLWAENANEDTSNVKIYFPNIEKLTNLTLSNKLDMSPIMAMQAEPKCR